MTNEYGNELLHKVLLSAMKDIDRICRENGLRYYLHAGTLLGAVNHKGFIPWDDDVDISMFREDYENFIGIVSEKFADKYFMQTYASDPTYSNNRAVLRVLGTSVIHFHQCKDAHSEIGIDIVPLDSVPDSKLAQRIQQAEIWCVDAAVQIKRGEIIPNHPFMKCLKLLSRKDRVVLGRKIDKLCTRYNKKKTKCVGLLSYTGKNPYTGVSGYYNDVLLREWYDNLVYLPFEDTEFMTIAGYKEDLLHRYGPRYMEPYPEEKRVTKHNVKTYEIEPWVMERIK